MTLKPEDYRLSMKISRRGKNDSDDLRSLLVHRLTDTAKLILRRPLRDQGKFGLYCEPCRDAWSYRTDVPTHLVCPTCGRHYRVELVVYEQVMPDGSPIYEPIAAREPEPKDES